MLQDVPAFIMRVLFAALSIPPRLDNAAFALRPPLRCAGPRVVRP